MMYAFNGGCTPKSHVGAQKGYQLWLNYRIYNRLGYSVSWQRRHIMPSGTWNMHTTVQQEHTCHSLVLEETPTMV